MTQDVSAAPPWFERALATPSASAFVEVRGTRIHYRTWGSEGRPGVALVHGSNAHLEWWRFVAPGLADQFRVVALDLSGHGESGWRTRYTGEDFADEIWAVCEAARLGPRPYVVGHSFGGFAVLEAGHRHGHRFGGIVLMDFTVRPPEDYTEWGMRARTEGKSPRGTRVYQDRDAALARFRLLPEQPVRHPPVIDYIASRSLRAVEGGWTWKFDPTLFDHMEMGREQRDKFATLACRCALVLGEHSEDSGAQSADYMSEITAGVLPIIVIPDTHHHFMFDDPVATTMATKALLLAWLQEDQTERMKAALARALTAN